MIRNALTGSQIRVTRTVSLVVLINVLIMLISTYVEYIHIGEKNYYYTDLVLPSITG